MNNFNEIYPFAIVGFDNSFPSPDEFITNISEVLKAIHSTEIKCNMLHKPACVCSLNCDKNDSVNFLFCIDSEVGIPELESILFDYNGNPLSSDVINELLSIYFGFPKYNTILLKVAYRLPCHDQSNLVMVHPE